MVTQYDTQHDITLIVIQYDTQHNITLIVIQYDTQHDIALTGQWRYNMTLNMISL